MIVDAQIHLWRSGTPLPPHRTKPYAISDAIRDMNAAGIDAAVIHPPSWDQDANEQALEAARTYPDRFAILGRFALDRPESQALVDGWKCRPGMLGLRFTFLQENMKSWARDGTMDWLWPAAERAGIPVALHAAEFLPVIGQVAERHPQLRLIVDHMGTVRGRKGEAAFATLPQLIALAKYPNVAVKATGGPGYATDGYPFRSLNKYYRSVYDAFGPKRMFWGTDITRMPCSWRQCVTHVTDELHWLSSDDKEFIMGRALCEWINWSRPC